MPLAVRSIDAIFRRSSANARTRNSLFLNHGNGISPALWRGIAFARAVARDWIRGLREASGRERLAGAERAQRGALECLAQAPGLHLYLSGEATQIAAQG